MSPARALASTLALLLAAPIAAAPPLCGAVIPPGGVDLEGRAIPSLLPDDARAAVLLFVRTDCPISNRYAPDIGELAARFRASRVAFWLVYPDPEATPEQIRAHVAEHALDVPPLRVVRDPGHDLVALAEARVTPEAAVLRADGSLAYHGRIDDRYGALSRPRPAAARHDLQDALESVLAGRAVADGATPAVGCAIADLAP